MKVITTYILTLEQQKKNKDLQRMIVGGRCFKAKKGEYDGGEI